MSNLILIAAAIAASPVPPAAASPSSAETDPVLATSTLLLEDDLLKTSRGGFTIIVNDQTLEAITSGNTIIGDYTAGSIALTDHALSNFTGVGNFLINTGAQNSLQTGMSLTINTGP